MDEIVRAYQRLARTVDEAAKLAESTRQWAVLLLVDAEHQIGELRRRQKERAGEGRKEKGR